MVLEAKDIIYGVTGLVATVGSGTVGWLVLRAVGGIDDSIKTLVRTVTYQGHTQAYHGERLVRVEAKLDLAPLPVPALAPVD